MRTAIVAGFLCCLTVTAGPVPAQNAVSPDELGRRQLQAAQRLEQSGQDAEAAQAYRKLLSRAPEGRWADEALVALARLACPADRAELAPDGGLPCEPDRIGAALEELRKLEALCPGREACADGAWRRAVLRWLPSPGRHDPAAARALLTTFPVLYPESPRVPRALALASELHRRAGAAREAGRLAFDLLAGWPDHPRAADAWLVLARLELEQGRSPDALHALGRAQALAGGGDDGSRAARIARGWTSQVDRLVWAEARGAPLWSPPERGPALEDAADLAFDPAGRLVAALPREDAVVVLGADGSVAERRPLEEARSVAFDRWGRPWAAGEESLAGPTGIALALPEDVRIAAVIPAGAAAAWILDARHERLHWTEVGLASPRTVTLADRTEPVAAVGEPDGDGLWLLDARRGRLERRDANGELVTVTELEAVVEEPVDLALGPLGHAFVLDAEGPEVWIVAPDGELLGYHSVPGGEATPWRDPSAIAIDTSGRLAIYDEGEGEVRWLR